MKKNNVKRKAVRRLVTLAMAVVMVLAFSTAVFAAGITEKQALNIALKDAGLRTTQVKRIETELEKGEYEVEFVKKTDGTKYEYEIKASNGIIKSKEIEYKYTVPASAKKITVNTAYQKAAAYAGVSLKNVTGKKCVYKSRKKLYEVSFRAGKYRYEFEVLAANGKIVEFEQKLIA